MKIAQESYEVRIDDHVIKYTLTLEESLDGNEISVRIHSGENGVRDKHIDVSESKCECNAPLLFRDWSMEFLKKYLNLKPECEIKRTILKKEHKSYFRKPDSDGMYDDGFTVGELIELLKDADPDALIITGRNPDHCDTYLYGVSIGKGLVGLYSDTEEQWEKEWEEEWGEEP